jgi:hypothetical protein
LAAADRVWIFHGDGAVGHVHGDGVRDDHREDLG